jgi:dTDP-4-amino-4,6-dideoxygalactose transaminase/lipopolysaccharide/colanic/teichoic acid biosynthesis glycosyltransferase
MAVKNRIYLSSPHMSEEGYEREYIEAAFKSNWIAPVGENVDKFEAELAGRIGAASAAALSSGTAALHLALKAAGAGEGDVAFCQDLTFAATAFPIMYQRAAPVFIDSERETWNMSAEALESAFEKYNPKAVIVTHLYGIAADLDRILEIGNKRGDPLIEDAAESLGTARNGKYTGTFGEYGIFSFNGNKIITTSGGGALVGSDAERIEKARFWATQSREKAGWYQHNEIGYNYRMSNVAAGIGRGQLKVLDERIAKKRYIFEYYREKLSDIEEISFYAAGNPEETNFWLTRVLLGGNLRPADIIGALEMENVEARRVWKPMHLQPVFGDRDFIGSGVSEEIFNRGVCLPSDTKMSDEDLDRIVAIVRKVCGRKETRGKSAQASVAPPETAIINPKIYPCVKRILDFILALGGLIVLFPGLLIIAALVKINLGSPVIFKQKRPGLNEKIFTLYKFRTMTNAKDARGKPLPDAERLTAFGKFLRSVSLDELPELWNIVKGDMSIVGPRPLLTQYLPLYSARQRRRSEVRPGLTGLAQISGRNAVDWEEKFNLDVRYVDNANFFMDLKIALLTVPKVFRREGITSPSSETMEEFTGNGAKPRV